ncbi:MAG: TIGR00730 family Rossman fold protein [Clostridia bacterium]|nr:TIGR00730 family Rossman fold protein [Clostridia bacterium]
MKICVYGASSNIISDEYIKKVETLGMELAKKGHSLVFGGGANGLMGAAARGFSKENAQIIGVVPGFLNVDGLLFDKCTELICTETMRERKKILEDSSDAFIVTPGGVGTFDEFFEIITLKQLGRHNKPIVIFNINGYFDELQKLMEKALSEKMLAEKSLKLYMITNDISEVISYLENYKEEAYSINETKFIGSK